MSIVDPYALLVFRWLPLRCVRANCAFVRMQITRIQKSNDFHVEKDEDVAERNTFYCQCRISYVIGSMRGRRTNGQRQAHKRLLVKLFALSAASLAKCRLPTGEHVSRLSCYSNGSHIHAINEVLLHSDGTYRLDAGLLID